MRIARKSVHAVLLCASILLPQAAPAQAPPRYRIEDPEDAVPAHQRDEREDRDDAERGTGDSRYERERRRIDDAYDPERGDDDYETGADADREDGRYESRGRRSADEAPQRGRGGSGAADQLWLLENALDRYREIERRGGWKKVPTDLSMGQPYSYDCQRLELLERRLMVEGYLRRLSVPPPAAPAPVPPGQTPPPRPPRPEPMGQFGPCKYTNALTEAVRNFQADRKVKGDGQVGALTFAELNRPVDEIIEILERDIARWKSVALHPSGTYLLVNIPFFELIAYERGREVLRMPVIVGQPGWQTPVFNDELEHIILNPDWGIPDNIAKREIWPLVKRDPNYLRKQNMTGGPGGLRQRPGPMNPLGRIKFMMPNKHDVYLHDTPYKDAFNYPSRTFSHGCVRLGKPMDLAHYLLRDDPQWSPSRLESAIATKRTQQINLRNHMPVHIVYSTTRVNERGGLEIRKDVYGKNGGPPALGPEEWERLQRQRQSGADVGP